MLRPRATKRREHGWVGLADGAHLIIAVPLGFVLGYVLYARDQARSDNKQLHVRIGDLLERVSLLEYSVKSLRRDAPAVQEVAADPLPDAAPVAPVAPVIEAPPLETKRSEASLDVPWVTEPRAPAAMPPSFTPAAAPRASVASSQWAAAQVALAIIGLTAALLVWLAHKLKWTWPLKLSWGFFVAHIVLAAAAVVMAIEGALMPSRHYGWIVWPLAWGFFYARLAWERGAALGAPPNAQTTLHVGGLWLLTAMITAEVALRIDTIAGAGWFHGIWGAVPALALWFVVQYAMRWPMRAAPFAYASIGAPGLAVFALGWLVFVSVFTAGDPAPIPYLPLLNPLDLASLLALVAVLRWHLADQRVSWQRPVRFALGAAGFIALNAAALRAVHFLGGVPWNVDALSESLVVQAVLSLLWTMTAMALMVFAHRRTTRGWWTVGAVLLAAVVVKLFFIDLSGQGTIARIVSFVGVGVLILLIGYLAPVPPSAPQPARSAA